MRNFLLNLLTICIILVVLVAGFTIVRAINQDGSDLMNYVRPLTAPEQQPTAAPIIQIVTATLAPIVPTAAPAVKPDQAVATPWSPEEPAQDTAVEAAYDPGFLLACVDGKRAGRRVHPNCPANAAELMGVGR